MEAGYYGALYVSPAREKKRTRKGRLEAELENRVCVGDW